MKTKRRNLEMKRYFRIIKWYIYWHRMLQCWNTTKFKQDFIGPLFIDTALDKTHYRLKDVTGLLLDGTYHVNHIKKGSAHSPLGIADKKLQEVTLQDGSKELNYLPGTIMDYAALHSSKNNHNEI